MGLIRRFRQRRLEDLDIKIRGAQAAVSEAEEKGRFFEAQLHSKMLGQLEKEMDNVRRKLGLPPLKIPVIPFQPNR